MDAFGGESHQSARTICGTATGTALHWKIVALEDGRATAFVFDQADPRGADSCAARVTIRHIELRSRLKVFPDPRAAAMPLDIELGYAKAAGADPDLRR